MTNLQAPKRAMSAIAMAIAAAALALQPVAADVVGGASAAGAAAPAAQSTATPKPTATATPRPAATTRPAATARPAATTRPAATARPAATPTKDAGITVQPIGKSSNVNSYKTTVAMNLDGTSAGRAAKGDLNAEVQSIPASKKQSVAISGSMMSTLLGQYLPIPVSKLTVYLMDNQPYIFAQSLLSVCAVPRNAIAGLDQLQGGLSADVFLKGLTGSDKFYGTLVGEETVNGIPSRHYKIDAAAMNALAKTNGVDGSLKSGDVWLAKDGNWVTRLVIDGSGNLSQAAGVDFSGNAKITLNVSDVNKVPDIVLPGQCNRPIQI